MDWDVFWAVFVVIFIAIPLFMIWAFAIVDVFGRPDLRPISKCLWLFGILFLPVLGTVLYYLFRPAYPVARDRYVTPPV